MKLSFFYIQLTILIVVNLILFNFPLTNILGYEFSVVNSIVLVLLCGVFVIGLLKRSDLSSRGGLNLFLRTLTEANIIFLTVPLLMGLIASFFIRNCSIPAGLGYYSVITTPAIIIGTSLGLLSYFISIRFPKLIFFFSFIIIILLPLYELYFYPQIFFYNPILAYLPGTIYDEAVKIGWKLIAYRAANITFFLGCMFFVLRSLWGFPNFIRKEFIILLISLIPLIFFIFSHHFGYSTTQGRMKTALKGHISTEHFNIYYDESINKEKMSLVARLHEYYFSEISNYLKVYPDERTTSYIFRNSTQKQELLGTANADMAKPWLSSIFVNYQNYEQTLKHEIVHSLSAEFGATIFKLGGYLNPALTEGIASAADDEYDEHSIHFMAALAARNGYKINLEKLFSGLSFFGQVSGLSYIFAGSFSKFLIDTYGVEKYKEVYSGQDFKTVYRSDVSGLTKEYFKFLDKYPGEYTDAMADYYFGRLTIFSKPCARYIAERINDGWQKFYSGRYDESRQEFSVLFRETESFSAFSGYINSLIMTNKDKSAFNLILENKDKYINTAYYFSSVLMLADAAVKLKKFDLADSLYNYIIEQYPSRNLVNVSLLRKELLKDTTAIIEYISGNDEEKYSILKRMNKDNLNYIFIPVLINLAEQFNVGYDSLMIDKNQIVPHNKMSSYSAYKLSEFALRNQKYSEAKELAEKAIEYKSNDQEIILSNLRRINWIIENPEVPDINLKQHSNKAEKNL